MPKRKTAKKTAVKHNRKSYSLVEGNSNEFLLVLGGGAFVLLSVVYFLSQQLR